MEVLYNRVLSKNNCKIDNGLRAMKVLSLVAFTHYYFNHEVINFYVFRQLKDELGDFGSASKIFATPIIYNERDYVWESKVIRELRVTSNVFQIKSPKLCRH